MTPRYIIELPAWIIPFFIGWVSCLFCNIVVKGLLEWWGSRER